MQQQKERIDRSTKGSDQSSIQKQGKSLTKGIATQLKTNLESSPMALNARQAKAIQLVSSNKTAVIQRYKNCKESDHNSSFVEKSIVADYRNMTGHTVSAEMALIDGYTKGKPNWRFADLVDEDDEEIYEIKSQATGAGVAAVEANYYKGLLNSNCVGTWTRGAKFGKRTINGQYFDIEYESPGNGAIVYSY